MNFDRKKLIIIAIVLASILTGILIYMLFTYERVLDTDNKKEKNIYDVQNNNSFVVKYGDYIYYVPEDKSAYSKMNTYSVNRFLGSDTSGEYIGESAISMKSLTISPILKIYANKLFVVQDKKTYKAQMPNQQTADAFCDGELQYIGENRALTLSDGNLYSVPYFEETFLPQKYQKVVNGNCIYLYEDDNMLYYSSTDSSGKTTVFGINKNEFQVKVLLELKSDAKKVVRLISTNKYVYCLVSYNERLYISRINKKSRESVDIDLSGYTDVSLFVEEKKDNIYFYASKNYGENRIYVCQGNSNDVNEYDGDVKSEQIQKYSIQFENNEIKFYKDKLFFVKFDVDVDNLTYVEIKDIAKINDFIYYKIYCTNSKNLEVTDDMYNTRHIDEENAQSGDRYIPTEKTIIVRVSTDGKIIQKLK